MTDDAAADPAAAIEFGTDGWRATLETFTDERVRWVAQGVATTLRERATVDDDGGGATGDEDTDAEYDPGTVAVGYDAREHSRGFAEQISRVLAANGHDALLSETDLPTPITAWTVTDRDLAGALVVTASHNPPEYNGVKFLPSDGTPALPPVTDAIEANLAEPTALPETEWGTVEEEDLVTPYLDHAVAFVPASLDGRRIAYDAMHGSGRGVTDDLLARAGADVDRLRCESDPEFGGGSPEPEPERVTELVERVTEGGAHLGVVNDGDADRIGVVTPARGYLDPNLFFAAIYDYLLDGGGDAGNVGDVGDVVRTVSTSSIVDRVAAAHEQTVHETAVGFKWVAAAMGDHDALMGGEESGGFGVRGHLRNKDGVLLALLAAAADAEEALDDRVDRLLDEHGEIHQGRVSVDCPDDRKQAVLDELDGKLPNEVAGSTVANVSTVDGFKIALEDGGWLLVRPSGTEPKMRIYGEGESEERVDELLAAGRDVVEPLV